MVQILMVWLSEFSYVPYQVSILASAFMMITCLRLLILILVCWEGRMGLSGNDLYWVYVKKQKYIPEIRKLFNVWEKQGVILWALQLTFAFIIPGKSRIPSKGEVGGTQGGG